MNLVKYEDVTYIKKLMLINFNFFENFHFSPILILRQRILINKRTLGPEPRGKKV